MIPTEEEVEQARQAYREQADKVRLIYGNAGATVFRDELWEFIQALYRAYQHARPKYEYGKPTTPHPWFSEGTPDHMNYLMHELYRTHSWLEDNENERNKLRDRWRSLREARKQP